MTPRTTASPTIVRTMRPPLFALCATAAFVSEDGVGTGWSSKSEAKAAGAVRRQPKTAAVIEAWRRISSEVRSPDQAHGSYRHMGSRPEVELLRPAGPMWCAAMAGSLWRCLRPALARLAIGPTRGRLHGRSRRWRGARRRGRGRYRRRGASRASRLEPQLIDDGAREHDQGEDVEPDQGDQHEDRAGADPQRRVL